MKVITRGGTKKWGCHAGDGRGRGRGTDLR
jgi:hypothetical protein